MARTKQTARLTTSGETVTAPRSQVSTHPAVLSAMATQPAATSQAVDPTSTVEAGVGSSAHGATPQALQASIPAAQVHGKQAQKEGAAEKSTAESQGGTSTGAVVPSSSVLQRRMKTLQEENFKLISDNRAVCDERDTLADELEVATAAKEAALRKVRELEEKLQKAEVEGGAEMKRKLREALVSVHSNLTRIAQLVVFFRRRCNGVRS